MSFLAMTGLQALLLSLATASAIVALYFLKLRRRRLVVPSSILWQRVLDERQARSLWEKLRKVLSILLAVAIGLLLALALARPDIPWLTGEHERVVIVMDTSPTMLSRTSDGKTRWQHATDRAGVLLAGGPRTEFRIAGTSGALDTPFTTDRKDLRDAISRMRPQAAPPRFPEIEADAKVYFVSDGVAPVNVPETAVRVSVFEPADNMGITAFEVRSTPASPEGYEAYLEVQNRGKKATVVDITVSGAGQQKIERHSKLEPGQPLREALDLSKFDGGAIQASIHSEGDALEMDNTAFAYLPVKRKTRTLLVTSGNTFLETALRLNGHVSLTVAKPAEYRESTGFDAIVFDRFAPSAAPSQPALIIGTPAASWLPKASGTMDKPSIGSSIEDHPVMRHVALHDVAIRRAARIDASNLTLLAGSPEAPLVVASERPKWVLLTFDLDATDFPFQAGFPVFVENVMAWFSREHVALKRAPGSVSIPMANAQIRTLDGKTIPSHQQLNETVFEANEPGLYVANEGDTRLHVAVNLTDRTLSNINASSYKDEPITMPPSPFLQHEVWYYLLLAAVLLIGAEWYTYHRRITL